VLRASGVTEKGTVRAINQDCLAIDERLQLMILADGMGGHNAGEVASRLAVETVLTRARHDLDGGFVEVWPHGFVDDLSIPANVLRTAIHLANASVLESSHASADLAGMGTTIVAAVVQDGRLSVAHVGDSRLYLWAQGRLRLLTRDDSWIAAVLETNPGVDRAVLQKHPMRHALTGVVGSVSRTNVHVYEEMLKGNERIVLTTDGVHGPLGEARIGELMAGGGSPEEVAATLVSSALSSGSHDNCSAIAAFYSA
jgi:protein phosphatase